MRFDVSLKHCSSLRWVATMVQIVGIVPVSKLAALEKDSTHETRWFKWPWVKWVSTTHGVSPLSLSAVEINKACAETSHLPTKAMMYSFWTVKGWLFGNSRVITLIRCFTL